MELSKRETKVSKKNCTFIPLFRLMNIFRYIQLHSEFFIVKAQKSIYKPLAA